MKTTPFQSVFKAHLFLFTLVAISPLLAGCNYGALLTGYISGMVMVSNLMLPARAVVGAITLQLINTL